jgi:BirA family biotin operon repressor/biotin-[acetyl-CoA-carboxylase] ligase
VKISDIKAEIKGGIGKEIFFYETVDSTNTVALDLAEKTIEGAVIIADSQQKGRGRLGRKWESPPGVNIYMSIVLIPKIESKDATLITIMASVACATALRSITGLHVAIKWPNDLMVSDKKIGGILTELKTDRGRIISAIVGIGINVNAGIDTYPADVQEIATSLKNETGISYSREIVISEILNEMDYWYKILNRMGKGIILLEWQKLTSTLGREVKVIVGKETFTGLAESIDSEGMLILRLPSGILKKISSGDLTILK